MSEELKLCYCGSPVTTLYQMKGMQMLWFVSCPQCHIRTHYHNTKEAAIGDWNARPEIQPDPLLAECVKMLKTMLAEFESAATSIETYQRIIDPVKDLIARCEEKADEK